MAIAPKTNFFAFIVDLLLLLFFAYCFLRFGVPRRKGRRKTDTLIFRHFGKLRIPLIHTHQEQKSPKGESESPWGLHIGSFWEIHFINPAEAQGKLLGAKLKERQSRCQSIKTPHLRQHENGGFPELKNGDFTKVQSHIAPMGKKGSLFPRRGAG
jgi:hypothetical protein